MERPGFGYERLESAVQVLVHPQGLALGIAPQKSAMSAVFAREPVQAEQRWNDRVMAEDVDMGVAFVAG